MDLLPEKDADLLDFKEQNKDEILHREKLFEPLIQCFQNERSKAESANSIVRILSKSELANPKFSGQSKEDTMNQILKSIPKWYLKSYKKGECLYHFGQDGQKVYLVIKGSALQLKPKPQKVLEQELHENKMKLQVVKMFKSMSFVSTNQDMQSSKILSRQSQILEKRASINTNQMNKSQDEILNTHQADNIDPSASSISNFQPNALQKLQSTCFQNAKFQMLKKQKTQILKLSGFKQLLHNNLNTDELKNLYFDEQTLTFKFERDFYINSGQLFGKTAVKDDSCRMNSVVVSSDDFSVLEISKSDYLKLFKPKGTDIVDQNQNNIASTTEKHPSQKSQKMELFSTTFESSVSKLKKFMSFFEYQSFPSNFGIWKKGQSTDKMYIILHGRVEISDDQPSDSQGSLTFIPLSPKKQKKRQVIYETGKGNLFGEFEIIDRLNERIFSVKTLEETEVFGISLNDYRLCESIVPEIVEQIINKCQVKRNWIAGLKSKIYSTLDHYEKSQLILNQKQEMKEFLNENQKSIKEIQIDTFQDTLQQNNSSSSPLMLRAMEIKKLKDSIQMHQQIKKQEQKQSSVNSLSPLQIPTKQASSSLPSPNQFLFSNQEIPRQFLKIDLFGDETTETNYERKLTKSPSQRQKLSRSPSISSSIKKNFFKSAVPYIPIDTEKSTQGLSTQMKSQNSPLSPLEKETYFFNSQVQEDEASPLFQRKVLKLNKLQIQQGQQHQISTFTQSVKDQEQEQLNQRQHIVISREASYQQLISPHKSGDRQINKSYQQFIEGSEISNIPETHMKNRTMILQRRANSQPKLYDINRLQSTDNIAGQQKNNNLHSSISALYLEGSLNEIQNDHESNFFKNENVQISQFEGGQQVSQLQQILNKQFKTVQNSKLKHIFSQQKENKKVNQYRINLEKKVDSSQPVSQQHLFSINSSYSPIKKKENTSSKLTTFNNITMQESLQNHPNKLQNNSSEDVIQYFHQQQLQQENYQQYPPSLVSLSNLNQPNCNINGGTNQIPKFEKNVSHNKSMSQAAPIGVSKNDSLIKKLNIESSFKEKIQKLLHSRKSSLANVTSNQSLQQNLKEKKQYGDIYDNQESQAINILNLQQFINKKRNISLHGQQAQNSSHDNTEHYVSEERKKFTGNEAEGSSSKQSFLINNKEKDTPSQSKEKPLSRKQSNYYTSLNSEHQRQNAQLLNEMLKRSQQCKFKVLNDQKLSQQQLVVQQSGKSIEIKTRNMSNPNITNITSTPFYSNMNSPHDQISHNPTPQTNHQFFSQNYFTKKFESKSSLSPSKPTSKQSNKPFFKLSQSINMHPNILASQQVQSSSQLQQLQQQQSQQPQQQQQSVITSSSQQKNEKQPEFLPDRNQKNKLPVQEKGAATFISGSFLNSLRLRQSIKNQN